MSSSLNTRAATHNDRRTSATLGTRPRVPSSRPEVKVQLGPADDVLPQDSASNSGSRRPMSGIDRLNGTARHTITEWQTERHQVTTRDNIRTSFRSPLKHAKTDKENAVSPQHRESGKSNAKPAEANELRKLHNLLTVSLKGLLRMTTQCHGNHKLPLQRILQLL